MVFVFLYSVFIFIYFLKHCFVFICMINFSALCSYWHFRHTASCEKRLSLDSVICRHFSALYLRVSYQSEWRKTSCMIKQVIIQCHQATSYYLRRRPPKSVKSSSIINTHNGKFALMQFMMTSSNGNIFRVTGHLCGEFTRDGIHRSPVNSPHKGQWRGALMFSLICVWINGWVNNREAGDLRCYRVLYDVTVMWILKVDQILAYCQSEYSSIRNSVRIVWIFVTQILIVSGLFKLQNSDVVVQTSVGWDNGWAICSYQNVVQQYSL